MVSFCGSFQVKTTKGAAERCVYVFYVGTACAYRSRHAQISLRANPISLQPFA